MTNEKTSGMPPSRSMGGLGRLGRVAVFFGTAGFAYPNVFVENIDIAKLDVKNKIKTEKL
ncbi:MAG: hypothetical protein ABL891_14530 [Burkholderiales bacterium]